MWPDYLEKKEVIRNELLRRAKANPMQRPTYAELGKAVGIPTQGPWRAVLDAIAKEELAACRPDITFLIQNSKGYPSRIMFKTKKKPDDKQKSYAVWRMQQIIDEYNSSEPNPFIALGWKRLPE
jgi:hypothetical protein